MSIVFATWTALALLLVGTLQMLPFISLESSVRLQFWLREVLRRLDDEIAALKAMARDEEEL